MWGHDIKGMKIHRRHHSCFPGLRTSQMWLLNSEALGISTPSLHRCDVMDFNLWRPYFHLDWALIFLTRVEGVFTLQGERRSVG